MQPQPQLQLSLGDHRTRRALQSSAASPSSASSMRRYLAVSGSSGCTSPQSYQAMATPPARPSMEDGAAHCGRDALDHEMAIMESTGRTHSHSHALSAILGGAARPSASLTSQPQSPSPRRSSLQYQTATRRSSTRDRVAADDKTWLPTRLARWRRRRRHGRRLLFWVAAAVAFGGCFALSFVVPRGPRPLAPVVLGAGLSLLSTLLVLVSFLRRRRLRRRPNELLAFVALSELGLALLSLVHVGAVCDLGGQCQPLGLRTCSVAAGLELFLLLASVGWFGAAILHLFVSVSNPFASYTRQLALSHVVVWSLSLLAAVVAPFALFSQQAQDALELSGAEICRAVGLVLPLLPADAANSATSRSRRLAQWQTLNLAFWGVLVLVVVVVVVAAQLSLVVGWWRSNSGTVIALKARRRLMKRMGIYVHALNVTWLVLLVLFFVYRANSAALAHMPVADSPETAADGLNMLEALFRFVLTAKGYVTCVVWLNINKPCCALGGLLCGLHQCRDDDDDPSLGISAASSASFSASSSAEHGVGGNLAANRAPTIMTMEAGARYAEQSGLHSPTPRDLASFGPGGPRENEVRELGLPTHRSMPTLTGAGHPTAGPTSPQPSDASSNDASSLASWEISQNNETLQREIIYYTVCGITKAIIRSAERARASSVTTRDVTAASDAALGVGTSTRASETSAARERTRSDGMLKTTLLVGAERDSTFVNSSFISHVQSVTITNSPRAYCEPRTALGASFAPGARATASAFGSSVTSGVDFEEEVHCARQSDSCWSQPQVGGRASSLTSSQHAWGRPQQLPQSHSFTQHHGFSRGHSPLASAISSGAGLASFHQTPGRFSLYPVSQVPFELFEQEIELQSSGSSTLEDSGTGSTRSAVFAGLRRTATSAFSQRLVFRSDRGRSGSTGASTSAIETGNVPAITTGTGGSRRSIASRDFFPEDPKPKVFVDYAPRDFRAIRLAFGLSDEKYLASFRTTAKERMSAGSSGAFMFFSGDNSLLVKSLKEKECRALVDMAPAYAQYLAAHPQSRLIRFFGCHRVRLYGRNFYFAVMSNVLHSERHTATITEKYDVKGSWVDRRARRPQRGDRVTCAECDAPYIFGGDGDGELGAVVGTQLGRRSSADERSVPQFPFHVHRPDIVLKDLDLERKLHLPSSVGAELHAQLVEDCEFLKDMGIMDYSLLVGIHKCHLREPRSTVGGADALANFEEPMEHELRLEELRGGSNLAPLGDDEVYFVGIIDILQQWDWEKQFEKAGKVLLGKSARGISAVAPAAYCRRFQVRCAQILLGGPAPEDLDQDWDVDASTTDTKEVKDSMGCKDPAGVEASGS